MAQWSICEGRAVFVQPSAAADTVLLLAILTKPGSDRMSARLGWIVDRDGQPVGDVAAETPEPVDTDLVRRRVTDLVTLLMLYRMTAAPSETTELPHVATGDLAGLSAKKQQARQKTHSLFRIVRLSSPPDRFGRPAAERGTGTWHLDHRVRVRGHFRWQPHGPGLRLRRLQWIAAHYRGPEDTPERVDLERR